jgi:Ca-activated chloride channel family protein
MKLSIILTLGASWLAATAGATWFVLERATPTTGTTGTSGTTGTTGTGGATAAAHVAAPATMAAPAGPPERHAPPAPPPDLSHFQAGSTLVVDGRLGHQVLPSAASETFLYVDVTAGATLAAAHPAPLELAIVIDRSGSMKGKRLANAMAATRTAIERLRDGDSVSVVTYADDAEVVLAPTVIDATSRGRVLAALARPRAGGDTCISCGIDTAMHLLSRQPGTIGRVLLLSDGLATAGVRDLPGFRRIADDVRRLGASITTIGVDVGYDERIMAALARDSNGEHFFVPDPVALPAIFDGAMAALTRAVAEDAELVVDVAAGVSVEQVYDRVSTSAGGQLIVPLGDFAAGDHKTALVRLRVTGGAAGSRPVAAVRLRYHDLVAGRLAADDGRLAVRISDDPAEAVAVDGLVSARVSARDSAAALEDASTLFRAGRTADASRLLNEQHARVEREHADARRNVEPLRLPDLDRAFARQKAALAGADEGFRPVTPVSAAPVAGDRAAEAQARRNQAGAFVLEQ